MDCATGGNRCPAAKVLLLADADHRWERLPNIFGTLGGGPGILGARRRVARARGAGKCSAYFKESTTMSLPETAARPEGATRTETVAFYFDVT
jgi:hypothetical protein